jgi:hypothetical protein
MGRDKSRLMLAALVLIHLAVTISHGSAHSAAGVGLAPAGMAFVLAVIIVGPLVGLLWMFVSPRQGAWLIALTMTGALIFGLVNHFVVPGADRVDHVAAASRVWFGTTAALLVLTEAAGAVLAVACERQAARRIA